MELNGKVIVVTGGADGIGAALCRRFAREGAAHVAVVGEGVDVAGEPGGGGGRRGGEADVGDGAGLAGGEVQLVDGTVYPKNRQL